MTTWDKEICLPGENVDDVLVDVTGDSGAQLQEQQVRLTQTCQSTRLRGRHQMFFDKSMEVGLPNIFRKYDF